MNAATSEMRLSLKSRVTKLTACSSAVTSDTPALQALKWISFAMSNCVMTAPAVFCSAISSCSRRFASSILTAAVGDVAKRVVAVFDGPLSPSASAARIWK